ncbi:MAG: PorV/PorQ family protein [Elusimicrobiales bacterium]|jgi:hypothetical protein
MKQSGIFLTAVMLADLMAPALYAGAGADGAAFLKIDAGARAAAMGGAFTAVADDASSVFYNPAGPALLRNQEIMLGHNEWLEGLRNEHAAYVHPVSSALTLFTGLAALITPPLAGYDDAGAPTGKFSVMDGAAGAGAAWAADGDLFFGVFIKGVYQQADGQKALAYAGDLGVIKKCGASLRLGAAAQNFGTPIKLYTDSFDLPRTYRGGAAYRVTDRLWVSGEAVKAGASDVTVAAGAEGSIEDTFLVRFGYKTGRAQYGGPGFSAGVGFREGDTSIDYAFTPFGDLGSTHRLTLSFRFGENRWEFAPGRKPERSRRSVRTPARTKPSRPVPAAAKQPPAAAEENPIKFIW